MGLRCPPSPRSTRGRGAIHAGVAQLWKSGRLVSGSVQVQLLSPAPIRLPNRVRAGAEGLSLETLSTLSAPRSAQPWPGPATDASHASRAVPGSPAPLAQRKSAWLRTTVTGVRIAQGVPGLARRSHAGPLNRPAGFDSWAGPQDKPRGSSAARTPACHAGDRGANPLRGPRDGWPSGLWRRIANPLRICVLRWFESSSILHTPA